MKNRPVSILLVIAGVILLLFAWSETAALTEVPSQNPGTTANGQNVYTFNVSLKDASILTVINATGSYGLVPVADASAAISGNISHYSVNPANSTGNMQANLTYSGLSGKYVFMELSNKNYAPFLIISTNGPLSSVSGLLVVLSILMIIGSVFTYPFRKNDDLELQDRQDEGTYP